MIIHISCVNYEEIFIGPDTKNFYTHKQAGILT